MKKYKLLLLILVVSIVGCSIAGCGNAKEQDNASTEETVSTETESPTIKETETETETQFPLPNIPEEKTFSSDEETYNYAISQMKEGKYYLAIKYFRKVSGYKDSATQLESAMEKMKQDFLMYDKFADKAVYSDVLQVFQYAYIDKSGNIRISDSQVPKVIKDNVFTPLLEYNSNVKIKKISIDFDYIQFKYQVPSSATVLTMGGEVVEFFFRDGNTGAYKAETITYTAKALKEGEKIVDVNDGQALSNLGNVYRMAYEMKSQEYYLALIDGATGVVNIPSHSRDYVENVLVVSDNGTIVSTGVYSNLFPVMVSWGDVISVEVWSGQCYKYCVGLTSAGEVLVAYEGGRTTLKPFSSDKKYTAIAAGGEHIAARATDGSIDVKSMSSWDEYGSGTISIPVSGNTVDTSGEDKTFSSDVQIYDYAKTCFDEGRYTEAIKYLRKIPDYKDTPSLKDAVYRYINHDFVAYEDARYLTQDYVFRYKDQDMINGTRRQTFQFGNSYINGEGKFITKEDPDKDYYKTHYKPLVDYNQDVAYKMISYSNVDVNPNSMQYVLTEAGEVLYIDKGITRQAATLVPVDKSMLAAGEKIDYICSNVAVSNSGNVYYMSGVKMTKDASMKDIVTVKCWNGVMMALTTNGKIIYRNPVGWGDVSALSNWSDIVSIDLYVEERMDLAYFMGLKSDGTVVAMRRNGKEIDLQLPSDKKFVTIACNKKGRLLALAADGEIYVTDVVNGKNK